LEEVAQTATEAMQISNRTLEALETLKNCRQLSAIFRACESLFIATEVSVDCCKQMIEPQKETEAVMVVTVLLNAMRACNRSVPHRRLIQLACGVLMNVARVNETYCERVFSTERCLTTLGDLLMTNKEDNDVLVGLLQLLRVFINMNSSIHQSDNNNNPSISTTTTAKRTQQAMQKRRCEKMKSVGIIDKLILLRSALERKTKAERTLAMKRQTINANTSVEHSMQLLQFVQRLTDDIQSILTNK
jgi:hypothetical protein